MCSLAGFIAIHNVSAQITGGNMVNYAVAMN